ncbi:MAG: histidine phosphatase family protein [Collinsella sp.]|nr:histidine phosphatase family protein [Collinsella sp.]
MAKTLILVRHGKPHPGGPDSPDELRELTDAGKAALAATDGFPRTFSLLTQAQRDSAAIWASPAVRAMQTAQAVCQAVGARDIETHSSLWAQDPVAFLGEVLTCESSCIIAVGHIPFMDRMVARLTGSELPFKPGAAACIELDANLEPGASRLLWFVQGPETR